MNASLRASTVPDQIFGTGESNDLEIGIRMKNTPVIILLFCCFVDSGEPTKCG